MNRTCKIVLAITLVLLCHTALHAQDSAVAIERPVLSAYTIEAGTSHIADTYLSPLKYDGPKLGFSYERMQAMRFNPQKWVMRLKWGINGDMTRNPARSTSIYGLNIDFGWGMAHRWHVADNWTFMAGGSTGIDAGILYAAHNSNNPVSAKAAWTVNALGAAVYNGKIGRVPFCARYLAEMPLTGVFFSPEYGQLYYEIYLGNHSNLARVAWPGNFFRLNNLATVDLRLGRTIVRLGYRCLIMSTKTSGIVTRDISHTAVIGFVSEWLSLSAGRKSVDKAKIINALY